MSPAYIRLLALVLVAASAGTAFAQSNDALLNLLVKKGIITAEEAAGVRTELQAAADTGDTDPAVPPVAATGPVSEPGGGAPAAAAEPANWVARSGAAALENVTLSARLQAQYAGGSIDIKGESDDPDAVSHFFTRRAYLGVRARLAEGWTGKLTYDFASENLREAFVQWKFSDALTIDAGLRKAPIAFEEFLTSSSAIKPIERSAATRYFVEPNNGRRLGAGAYRQGVFADAKHGNFTYSAAITNPERVDSAGSAGDGSNNSPAFWGHVGYGGSTETGNYRFGGSFGILPEQGGRTLGTGSDLVVTSVYGDLNLHDWSFAGEIFWADNEDGAIDGTDANPWGWWIQPSYRTGPWEAVARYSFVDSDGRGVQIGDGVRSWPSSVTMDRMYETFFGGNWYIRENYVKLQAGVILAGSRDGLLEGPDKATAKGFRTQVQVNY